MAAKMGASTENVGQTGAEVRNEINLVWQADKIDVIFSSQHPDNQTAVAVLKIQSPAEDAGFRGLFCVGSK